MSTASEYLAFAPVPPPEDLGEAAYLAITDPNAAALENRAIAWVFDIGAAPIDIVEQPATETITDLLNSINCRQGDVGCVSEGRGTTTLADGSNAVWIHYPFGTSVEWIDSRGVDIVVKGPFDEIPLETAMSVANSMATSD